MSAYGSAVARGAGKLRRVIESYAHRGRGRGGLALGPLTVLSGSNDPYRYDRPVAHEQGQWLAEQVDRFLGPYKNIHPRGLHYMLVSTSDLVKPSGAIYVNTNEDWLWLEDVASAARWLGYVPFDRIIDQRNSAPELFIPQASTNSGRLALSGGGWWTLEDPLLALPGFDTSTAPQPKQPYRIVLIGEKSSLGGVLRPIAERVAGELLLLTGEISTTMIADLARRADADGRPCAVLYFSDFDPSGWQMPISVARKLQALHDLHHPDLHIELHAVALNIEQVRAHDLPSTPLKATELRGDRWREVWGVEQTEIDALEALRPGALRRIALDAVRPFYDETLAQRERDARYEWEQAAEEALRDHPAYALACEEMETARGRVDAAYDLARTAAARFEAETEAALDPLRDLQLPDYVGAEPFLESGPAPLFTTYDDFETATLRLKARKALDGEG